MKNAICDCCDEQIADLPYAFYSSFMVLVPELSKMQIAGVNAELGGLIYCLRCTERLITDVNIAGQKPVVLEVGIEHLENMAEVIDSGRDSGVYERCRALGMNALEAKTAARDLAAAHFENQALGFEVIRDFWTSDRK